jgi:hypothetical protein
MTAENNTWDAQPSLVFLFEVAADDTAIICQRSVQSFDVRCQWVKVVPEIGISFVRALMHGPRFWRGTGLRAAPPLVLRYTKHGLVSLM